MHIQGDTVLHYAVLTGQTENVEKLLNHGMRVQHQSTADGATPLHRAAQIGNIKIATLLINHGAELNSTNYLGQTPLDVSIQFHNDSFSEFIELKGGYKLRTPNRQNKGKNSQKKFRNRRRTNKDTKQSAIPAEKIDQQELQDHLVVESECEHNKKQAKQKLPDLIICKDYSQIEQCTGKFTEVLLHKIMRFKSIISGF